MFKVGDIITGLPHNGYGWTTDNAVMEIIDFDYGMTVRIIAHSKDDICIGDTYSVSPDAFTLKDTVTSISLRLDGNFNIISGDLTHAEQKDFYIALQEWKPECEGTSTEPRVQAVEERAEYVSPTFAPHHIELGVGPISELAIQSADWNAFLEGLESTELSERSREQAEYFSHPLPILPDYQPPSMDSGEGRSIDVVRAGTQGRSTHITQRAQREGYRDANLQRWITGLQRPIIR